VLAKMNGASFFLLNQIISSTHDRVMGRKLAIVFTAPNVENVCFR
jgi:hypothetical protein